MNLCQEGGKSLTVDRSFQFAHFSPHLDVDDLSEISSGDGGSHFRDSSLEHLFD